ncbi:MAG: ABC transporter ATP-binding protein/permease [Gammaproteobacteria bacterium]|nr:ABC transporter ATP-binding protein/permease [Gammaproteobacteria bacterium]
MIFTLTLLAVTTEGFGLALLLPMISQLGIASVDAMDSGFTSFINGLLDWIGIKGSVTGMLVFIAIIFLIKGILKFCEGVYKAKLKSSLMRDLRSELFDAYATMDYRYYIQHNAGHFVNLINVQIGNFVGSFDQFVRFLISLITVAAYFLFAFLVSWEFASMALIFGGGVLLLFRRLNRYVRKMSQLTVNELGILNHFIVQAMQTFKYIASTGQVEPLRNAILKSNKHLTKCLRHQDIAIAFTQAIREPFSIIVLLGIIVIQFVFFKADLAPILVSLLLIYRAIGYVFTLQTAWQRTMGMVGSLEILEKEFEDTKIHKQNSGDVTIQPLKKGIELKNVSFSYDVKNGDVLKNISMFIPANKTVALVGESGSGKSTLVDLLTLLLKPTNGELLIDGVKIESDMNLQSWRSQIGYVSQETVVFDDTIANNISLWRGDYNQDNDVKKDIEHVAEKTHIINFVKEMPDGFNAVVGDRGIRLSGGQCQRLFIARELYKKPKLLILDEATSSLDSESELIIKNSIDELHGETTVVIIAHRLSTIKNADYIYVLDNGNVAEQGTYQDLVDTEQGNFNRLVSLQKL